MGGNCEHASQKSMKYNYFYIKSFFQSERFQPLFFTKVCKLL